MVSFFSCFLRNSPLASRLVPPESLANPRFSRFLPSHPALSRVSQLSCLFTLALRDSDPHYEAVKKNGGIGIPAFVLEDGTVTLDLGDVLK